MHKGLVTILLIGGLSLPFAYSAAIRAAEPADEVQQSLPERKDDKLYRILTSKSPDIGKDLDKLAADPNWRPTGVDVAAAIEQLPSIQSIVVQFKVLSLLAKSPQECARWVDVLVDHIAKEKPAPEAFFAYLPLLEQIAYVNSCRCISPCLARLWKADDQRVTHLWALRVSAFNVGDWKGEYREWKAGLSKSGQQKAEAIILELDKRVAEAERDGSKNGK